MTTPDEQTVSGVPISIDGLSKIFGLDLAQPFQALKEVSLSIKSGEFVSVVGASGCGKSTLMLLVCGLLPPTTGTILVNESIVNKPLTDVGIAFQDHLLLDFRTAMQNVMLHADIRRLPREQVAEKAKELFMQLHLEDAMDKYPKQLSGGMRQRVSLIRSLVHDPAVLMLDEPFGALDALTRLQVRMDLESLWMRRRPTVLFITHSVEEAVGLSDRVIVMSPSPGTVVDDVHVDLARPRPITLGDAPEFGAYVDRIHRHFERQGILHGFGMIPKNN